MHECLHRRADLRARQRSRYKRGIQERALGPPPSVSFAVAKEKVGHLLRLWKNPGTTVALHEFAAKYKHRAQAKRRDGIRKQLYRFDKVARQGPEARGRVRPQR